MAKRVKAQSPTEHSATPRVTGRAQRSTAKRNTKVSKAGTQTANTDAKPSAAKTARGGALGVSIRMYRLGVGDCFLIRFHKPDGGAHHMVIDCGVHQAQSGGAERIPKVVADLKQLTNGRIDTLAVTHEHWDHISGFSQAEAEFKQFKVGEIWAAWTEDSTDALAKTLKEKKGKAIAALGKAEARMRLAGRADGDNPLTGLLGFFGDTTGAKLAKAGNVLKSLVSDKQSIRYRKPGEPPIELPDLDVRVFVLGPPRSVEAIHRSDPTKGGDEVYIFGRFGAALEALEPALMTDATVPFDARFAIPLGGTQALPFFQRFYWADKAPESGLERVEETQRWRRIDEDWVDAATSLALKLDEDTNNTSLVLAFEIGPKERGGPVLLFAADAQVGNWLSWQTLEWEYHGRKITGPDLLRRTVLYKVGHHASQNATLKAQGLELMEALELALVPTDDQMAKKVGWGTLPWPNLLEQLEEKTKKRVIRTDRDLNRKLDGFEVEEDPLFYQIQL